MSEIAAGYVSIIPKFGAGFKKSIESEIGGAGDAGGKAMGKSAGAGFSGVFVGTLAANLGAKVVSAVTAPIRNAFGGGWRRLMSIEQAEMTLKSLGLDVKASMQSVDDAVTGTKFAISDAAGMAGILGASGIAAGEEMTKWLKLTANAAQFTGREFTDIQAIMTEVVGTGRITGETLNRLPIAASALAQHLGVSQQEVRKLASQGKISADEFAEAMGGTLGSLAADMGEGFEAIAANLRTQLNRAMAGLQKPLLNALKPIMGALLPIMRGVAGQAAALGETFGTWLQPKAEAFAQSISELPSKIRAVADSVSPLVGALKSAYSDAGGGFAGIVAVLQTAVGEAVSWLSNGGAKQIADALLRGRENFLTAALAVFEALVEALAETLPQLVQFLTGTVLPGLVSTLTAAIPVIVDAAITLFGGLIEGLTTAIPLLIEAVAGILPPLLEAVVALIPALTDGAVELFGALIDGLLVALPILSAAISDALPRIIEAVLSLLPDLVEAAVTLFSALVTGVTEALPVIIQAVIDIIPAIVETLIEQSPMILDAALTLFGGLTMGLLEALPSLMTSIQSDLIPRTIAAIQAAIPGFTEVAKGWISGMQAGLVERWPGMQGWFTSLKDKVNSAIGNAAGFIIGKGRDTIAGLERGVAERWAAVRAWFANLGSMVTSAIGSALGWLTGRGREAMSGMLTGVTGGWVNVRAWFSNLGSMVTGAISGAGTWLWNSGRSIIEGLIGGIRSMAQQVRNAVSNVLQSARNLLPFSPAKEGPFSGRGWTLYSGRSMVDGLIQGLTEREGALRATTRGLLEPLQGNLTAKVQTGAGSALGGVHIGSLSLQLPEWVRDFDTLTQFVANLELNAHHAGGMA